MTLAVAIYAAVMSTAALCWQLVQYRLSGIRAAIELRHGFIVMDSDNPEVAQTEFTTSLPVFGPQFPDYRPHTFFVTVRNVGRLPFSVSDPEMILKKGISVKSAVFKSKPDKSVVGVGEAARWVFSLPSLADHVDPLKQRVGVEKLQMRAIVGLGNGRYIVSKEWVSW